MTGSRIDTLREMLERNPEDPRLHFGLASEYEKLERWQDAADQLRAYLALAEDEGNAYGRLARALLALDQPDEARQAYRDGIDAARRHGHPSMAAEFEEELSELDSAG